MRLTRIYCPENLPASRSLELSGERLHYLRNVLRLNKGERLVLFNERDGEFTASIAGFEKNTLAVSAQEQRRPPRAPKLDISLGLALSRGERMDYGIQKSTELGVSGITPLRCEHCEARLKPERMEHRLGHWRRLSLSAAEQCDRLDLPRLNEPLDFTRWLEGGTGGLRLLFHPGGGDALPDTLDGNGLQVTVGPEGGFSDAELDLAGARGMLICGLGPRVLRTETAPVVALAILQYRYGDLAG